MLKGDTLCVVSAMKMEMAVAAPMDGTVKKISVESGFKVQGEDLLLEIE